MCQNQLEKYWFTQCPPANTVGLGVCMYNKFTGRSCHSTRFLFWPLYYWVIRKKSGKKSDHSSLYYPSRLMRLKKAVKAKWHFYHNNLRVSQTWVGGHTLKIFPIYWLLAIKLPCNPSKFPYFRIIKYNIYSTIFLIVLYDVRIIFWSTCWINLFLSVTHKISGKARGMAIDSMLLWGTVVLHCHHSLCICTRDE